MDLWSKGLGRRVLSLRLGERESLAVEGEELVVEGVMHAPTYWDYKVNLAEQDVLEFLELLQRPDALRFVAGDKERLKLLGTALSSAGVFLARTLRLLLLGVPEPDHPSEAQTQGLLSEGGTDGRTG